MSVNVLCAHWMSCAFYSVAYLNTINFNESWLTDKRMVDIPVVDQYINSLYWVITTMATVGYGDINP